MTEKLILQSEAPGASEIAIQSASRLAVWLIGTPAVALLIILWTRG